MISLGEFVANFADTLFVLAWNYLLTLCRCIFMLRTGLYRTLVRGYRTKSNRIGLGTLSCFNTLMCYALLPYAQPSYSTYAAGDVFSQAMALRNNDRFFVYLLVAFALFTLASFLVTSIGINVARRVRAAPHWRVDEFRLLRFLPHLVVSTGSLMAILIGICISKLMSLAMVWGYDGESVRQKLSWIGLLLLGAYALLIWPRQGLLPYRKSIRMPLDIPSFEKSIVICGTLLLSSFLPAYFVFQLTSLAYIQSAKPPPAVRPVELGVECGYSIDKHSYIFYVKARNPGTVPVLVRQLSLDLDNTRMPVKILKNAGELPVVEPNAIVILAVVAGGDLPENENEKRDLDQESEEFCTNVHNVHVEFEDIF